MERQNEVIGTDKRDITGTGVNASVAVAVVSYVDLHRWCPTPPPAAARTHRRREVAVQDLGMRGINAAFQTLEPVALLNHFGHMAVRFRNLRPGEPGQRWLQLRWSHVGPDNAPNLHGGIRRGMHLVLEIQLF